MSKSFSQSSSSDLKLQNFVYTAKTGDFVVSIIPSFSPEESVVEKFIYVWYYKVLIHNIGSLSCQLIRRFWRIINGLGQVTEVSGEGVVGDQPILNPHEFYEYVSSVPLPTPSGFMAGAYLLQFPDGSQLSIKIPTFSLDSPYVFTGLQ